MVGYESWLLSLGGIFVREFNYFCPRVTKSALIKPCKDDDYYFDVLGGHVIAVYLQLFAHCARSLLLVRLFCLSSWSLLVCI